MSGLPRPRPLSAMATALIAALAATSPAHAVLFPWVAASTGPSLANTTMPGVAAQSGDRVFAVGQFDGTIDLGDGVARVANGSGANVSAFTQVLGTGGAVNWAWVPTSGPSAAVGGGAAVSLAPRGQAVVAGSFSGSAVDLGDGTLRTSANAGAQRSAFTQVVDAAGSVAWTTTAGGTGLSSARGVAATVDGGALVAGFVQGVDVDLGDGLLRTSPRSGADRAMFRQALRSDGSVKWATTSDASGTSEALAYAVAALPDGEGLVSGYFRGAAVNLGDGISRTSGNGGASNSSFLMLTRADGSVAWVLTSRVSGASDVRLYGVSALPGGGAVATGFFRGVDVDLGDGVPRTSPNDGAQGSGSMFTQAVGPDGAVRWTRVSTAPAGPSTSAQGNAVSARPDGSALVSGLFSGDAVDFGDGVPRASSPTNAWGMASLMFTPDGSVAWVNTARAATGESQGWGMSALPDGHAAVSGKFRGTGVDLGDGVLRESGNGGNATSVFTQMLLAPPPAPAAPTVVMDGGSATVTITPLGGTAITRYTVVASPGGQTCSITPPATSCVVSGLMPGTAYSFTVRAVNAAGEGAASPPTQAGAPGPSAPADGARLAVVLLPQRTRLVSGQGMRMAVRTRNVGVATATGVTSCLRLPADFVVPSRGSAVRSGRTFCFRLGNLASGGMATTWISVRAATLRAVTRRVAGSAQSDSASPTRVAAQPVAIRLSPRPARARVTG